MITLTNPRMGTHRMSRSSHIRDSSGVVFKMDQKRMGVSSGSGSKRDWRKQRQHILCPNAVSLPEVLVIILAIPATIFSSQRVDIIESMLVKEPFQLPEIPDIRPDIPVALRIAGIHRENHMPPRTVRSPGLFLYIPPHRLPTPVVIP